MHDLLLAHQDELLPMHLRRYARGARPRRRALLGRACTDREYAAARRPTTSPSADASGVSGTPTFFINGRRHQGAYDIATLTAEVRAALGPLSTGQSSNRR